MRLLQIRNQTDGTYLVLEGNRIRRRTLHTLSTAGHHSVRPRDTSYDLQCESCYSCSVCESCGSCIIKSNIIRGTKLIKIIDGGLEISSITENGVSKGRHGRTGGDIGKDLNKAQRSAIRKSGFDLDLEQFIGFDRTWRLVNKLNIIWLNRNIDCG